MSRKLLTGLLLLLAALVGLAPPTAAQGSVGSIRGRLVDPAGQPVAGVVVAAVDVLDPARMHKTTSDASGSFLLKGLPVGSYQVFAKTAGTPWSAKDASPMLDVRAGATQDVNMTLLKLGAMTAAAARAPAPAKTGIATLQRYGGDATVVRAGNDVTLFPGLGLMRHDTMVTRSGSAEVSFNDGTLLRIGSDSRVEIDESAQGRDVRVFFGRLWARVVRWKERPTQFSTGQTIAAVRGTVLEYLALPDGTVHVGVTEGMVQVNVTLPSGQLASATLGAGQQLAVPPGGAPGVPAPFQSGQIAQAGSTASGSASGATASAASSGAGGAASAGASAASIVGVAAAGAAAGLGAYSAVKAGNTQDELEALQDQLDDLSDQLDQQRQAFDDFRDDVREFASEFRRR